MSSAPTPLRLLPAAAGQPVRFAMAAGSHSLAVLEARPHTNGQLRRSIGGPSSGFIWLKAAGGILKQEFF